MNPQLLILGLHRVGYAPKTAKIRGLFISPELLNFQLSLIQKLGFKFTTLRDALENPRGKRAVITFDDGYADNIENALPILRKFNAPATLFVITGDVGKRNVVWKEAGENLPADLLDWKSLKNLINEGWEIGSHAHEHVHLARYSEAEQNILIAKSIAEIKQNLGVTPISFAYPYGSFNAATKKNLERLGLKYAVTTKPTKLNDTFAVGDLFELTRVSLGGRKLHHFVKNCLKLSQAVSRFSLLKCLINFNQFTDSTVFSNDNSLINAFQKPLEKDVRQIR